MKKENTSFIERKIRFVWYYILREKENDNFNRLYEEDLIENFL